ncbi:MAG: glycosyltransferase, partial [Hassallia sp.]
YKRGSNGFSFSHCSVPVVSSVDHDYIAIASFLGYNEFEIAGLAALLAGIPALWMQAMDVFVHASDNEPFGLVVIEAIALGKPVIAGNAGRPTEIITHGVNGLLTPYGDFDALAIAILRYLDDQEFARNAAVAARQRALDFSTQRYAQNFINAVRCAVSNVSKVNTELPLT